MNLTEPLDRGSAAERARGARVSACRVVCRAAAAGRGADRLGAGGRLPWCRLDGRGTGVTAGATWHGRACGRVGLGTRSGAWA